MVYVSGMQPLNVLLFTVLLALRTSARAAVIDPPSSLLLTKPVATPDTSPPLNQTISEPPKYVNALAPLFPILTQTASVIPPSPYTYHIPHDPTTAITFSTYTRRLSEVSTLECLLTLTQDVQIALTEALRDRDPSRVIPLRYIRTDAERASLIITPIDRQLKWITCAQTLQALRLFLNTWEYVGVSFDVVVQGVKVASGKLTGRWGVVR